MKVYRGPSSKSFSDNSHELVSRVLPDQLEEGIRSNALMQFNITKEAVERQAVCTAQFEDGDLIPMVAGLLSRVKGNQECLAKIRAAMKDKSTDDKGKLLVIQAALSHV